VKIPCTYFHPDLSINLETTGTVYSRPEASRDCSEPTVTKRKIARNLTPKFVEIPQAVDLPLPRTDRQIDRQADGRMDVAFHMRLSFIY
jgi:hypothetical protein